MNEHSQLTRFGLFDARVPRYTSYPTAPQFGPAVGPAQFESWVRAIPQGAEISLYLHVPFCRRLCWFCACRTQGTTTNEPVAAYVKVLKAEIALLAATLAPGVQLSRLHWGGGTPTLLDPSMIHDLAGTIFDVLPLAPKAEFSVEIDPNEIDTDRADALVAMGMNRASIGVQDFDPEIQRIIGREQSYELTRDVAQMLRDRGVASLNADILYGLPRQTNTRIAQSVEKLLSLRPDRVALYGYAHVPWMSRRQQMIPSDGMPTPPERLELFETARTLFTAAGYQGIGIDHFALPTDGMAQAATAKTLRRNFQGYTDDPATVLIGLGASSISRFPQGFAQNVSGTSDYTKAVRSGQFPIHRGHSFQGQDTLRARIIEALMCDFTVSRTEILRDFSISPAELDSLFAKADAQFQGMVSITPDALEIPVAARPLTRMIARVFDAYDGSKAQHSSAV